MRSQRGFTLIEVLLVVVIVLALAGIGFPRMQGSYYKARLSGAGREVIGMLRTAQSSAVLMETPVRVVFSPDEDSYWLEELDEQGRPIGPRKSRPRTRRRDRDVPRMQLSEGATRVRSLPRDVFFTAVYASAELTGDDLPCVVYYPDGSATPTTVVVQDKRENALNVEIYRTTGMVKLEPGLPEKEKEKRTLFIGRGGKRA